ncbi:hypothetical protein Tco_1544186 [Tanacetum coccineum]
MKEILKDNLLKGKNLMEDTDNKLDIALEINSNDEDLKNIIEKRNEIFIGGDDDDDDAPDGNNDENIRNGKEKKNFDEVNKEEGGSENVKDHNVEEVITEQKDENVEQKEKKVPDDMVWDKTNAIVPFDDYHDKEYNDNVLVHNQDYDYDVMYMIMLGQN